jgi:hypothetical protein
MLMRALNPFDTQSSYRARNSAVAVAVVTAVAAGGGGLDDVLFRTTSAQEGELETGMYYRTSCCRIGGDPAGKAAPTTLPVSRGAEPRGARLGVAGRDAVASSTASPLSARVGVRWWGVRRGVAGNIDRPLGSALLPPSPPGGEGNMATEGLGVCPLSGRGGLLATGVSIFLCTHIRILHICTYILYIFVYIHFGIHTYSRFYMPFAVQTIRHSLHSMFYMLDFECISF